MGVPYSTHGRDKCIQFRSESLTQTDYLQELGIDGKIILKCILGR